MFMQKKRPSEGGNHQTVRGGLAPKNDSKIIIPRFGKNASPNFPRGGGVLSVTWELVLMTVGTGTLVRLLFRLIDRIEG